MERTLEEALKHRRSYYVLSNTSLIPDQEIQKIVETAIMHTPSAFNSQSTRMVLLLKNNHTKLWNIVKETLRNIVPEKAFSKTENKIDTSFASGYGTVLFYEDQETVKKMQEQFPLYQENFPLWSAHTSGMHQWVVWTMLEDAGFGASLQHYNPLIDEKVAQTWNIPSSWKLIAQMPFGMPLDKPGDKTFLPIEDRLLVFK